MQAEAPNHPLLLPLREVVGSEMGKGEPRARQVGTAEPNVSEPLMTCRKRKNDVKTGGKSLTRDKSGGRLLTAQAASGMKVAGRQSRLLCGTWEPVTPMPREKHKWKPHASVRVPMRGTGAEQPVVVMSVLQWDGSEGVALSSL